MKRIAQYLGLIALTLAFTSCSPSKTKGVIAYTPLTLSNPFFKIIGDHITAEAAKNGYDTLMVDPDMDVKKQSDQFDDFISSGVTAIILVPCDRLSIGAAVKLANAKGIPVFTVDAKCAAEGAEIAGHVGTDNFQGGELAGQAMIKALGENGGKVLILDFKKAHSCVLRVAGFKKVIDAHNAGHTTGNGTTGGGGIFTTAAAELVADHATDHRADHATGNPVFILDRLLPLHGHLLTDFTGLLPGFHNRIHIHHFRIA